MRRQFILFEEVPHLEEDYFISGNPDQPDPHEGERYIYYDQDDPENCRIQVVKESLGSLVLRQEDTNGAEN